MAPSLPTSNIYNGGNSTEESMLITQNDNHSTTGSKEMSNKYTSTTTKIPSRPSLANLGGRLRTSSSSNSQSSQNTTFKTKACNVSEVSRSRSSQAAIPTSSKDLPKARSSRTSGLFDSLKGGQGHKARQTSFEVHSVRRERPLSDYFGPRQSSTDQGTAPTHGIDSPDTLAESLPRTPSFSSTQETSSSEQALQRIAPSAADSTEPYIARVKTDEERKLDVPVYPAPSSSASTTAKLSSHPPPVGRTRRSLAHALGRRLSGFCEPAVSSSGSNTTTNSSGANTAAAATTAPKASVKARSRESMEMASPPATDVKTTSFALRSMRKISIGSSAALDLDSDLTALRAQSSPATSMFDENAATTAPSSLKATSIPTTPGEGPQRLLSSPTISPSASTRNLYLHGQTSSMSVARFRNSRVRSESGNHAVDSGSGAGISPGGPGSPILFGTSIQQGEGLTPSEQLAALEAIAARGGRATPLLRHFEERGEGTDQRARKDLIGSYFTAEPGRFGGDEVDRPPPLPGKEADMSYVRSRQASSSGRLSLSTDPPLRNPLNPPTKNARRFSDRFELPSGSSSHEAPGSPYARQGLSARGRGWDAATLLNSFGQRAASSGTSPGSLLEALARLGKDQPDDEATEQSATRPWLAQAQRDLGQHSAGGSFAPVTSTGSSTLDWGMPDGVCPSTKVPAGPNPHIRAPSTEPQYQMPRSATLPVPATMDTTPYHFTPVSASTSLRGCESPSNHPSETSTDDNGVILPDSAWMDAHVNIESTVYESLSADHKAYVRERHQVAFLAAKNAFQRTYEEHMKDVLATLPTGTTIESQRGGRRAGHARDEADSAAGAADEGGDPHLQVPSIRH